MKHIIFVAAFFLISAPTYAEEIKVPLSIQYNSSERPAKFHSINYTKGVVGGVKFDRYEMGAAHFDNTNGKANESTNKNKWVVSCDVDEMTDKRTCSVIHNESRLFIWLENGKGVTRVTLFSHDFPGRTLAIRVGNSQPIRSNTIVGQQAKQLVAQMKPGAVVKTRHYSWPYDVPKDGKVTISGNSLNEAIKYAEWVLAGKYETNNDSASKALPMAKPSESVNISNQTHTHGDRVHSHPLPAQGKAHRHGVGPVGH